MTFDFAKYSVNEHASNSSVYIRSTHSFTNAIQSTSHRDIRRPLFFRWIPPSRFSSASSSQSLANLFPFSLLLSFSSPLSFSRASRAFAGLANFARRSPPRNPRRARPAILVEERGPNLNPRRKDSRIEIAQPLPHRDDECSRSDLRNVPGISFATLYSVVTFSNHTSISSVPLPPIFHESFFLHFILHTHTHTRAIVVHHSCCPIVI